MAATSTQPEAPAAAADPTIVALRKTLCDEATPLPIRFRALFSLKHLAKQASDAAASDAASAATAQAAIDAIAAAFGSPSALLKHELAYCLGQTGNVGAAGPPLRRLGALGHASDLAMLRAFRDRPGEEVVIRETCEIAIDRIEWANNATLRSHETLRQSDFASIDPAPPLSAESTDGAATIDKLAATLLDTAQPLFLRYRAMFALRDLASPPDLPTAVPAVQALARGFADASALFRHEIAFVFGQLSHPASIPALTAALSNLDEAGMVRHEAAEALGSLGDEKGVEDTLRLFLHDKEPVVRESVLVALDMADYEQGGQAEYALIPETAQAAS
ncbi:deoxyhypusine hydroxylase [Grosmannia clavigera kw1407]|uniref:Deoxyhypusine hydroxylase n=1 Tax=Grosmannia clavigera (strain kw1407 / UAMH 11150) TaxID=655863 RepID=F0XI17_GROCL|nr:deoxyhypusine hydroxylase [Grosmannia clavigera kw1407]EFX03300.1 deoxyhypusine hydroxylase [Grosmannia clavigera kw1407]